MKAPERILAEMAVSKLPPKQTRRRHGKLKRFRKPAGSRRLVKLRKDALDYATRHFRASQGGGFTTAKPIKITCRYNSAILKGIRNAAEREEKENGTGVLG